MGYDQWKTASPYDDIPDDGSCVQCGNKLPDDIKEDTPQWEGFCGMNCQQRHEMGLPMETQESES